MQAERLMLAYLKPNKVKLKISKTNKKKKKSSKYLIFKFLACKNNIKYTFQPIP